MPQTNFNIFIADMNLLSKWYNFDDKNRLIVTVSTIKYCKNK